MISEMRIIVNSCERLVVYGCTNANSIINFVFAMKVNRLEITNGRG